MTTLIWRQPLRVVSKMVGLGIFGGQAQQQPMANSGYSGLNLSMTGAPTAPHNPFAPQQAAPTPFMQGMFGQQQQQFTQQPVAPPSELEIQIALLQNQVPVEQFIASQQMGVLLELMSNLITLSVVEILRNAKFSIDEEDGIMSLDITSLPQSLQTISTENVTSQFSTLQANAQQAVTQSQQTQQGLLTYAQQSMMGGALEAALANDGLIEKVGSGAGSFMGKMIGMR